MKRVGVCPFFFAYKFVYFEKYIYICLVIKNNNKMKKYKTFTHYALVDEFENAIEIQLPTQKIVCPSCDRNGHHFRNDLDETSLVRSMQDDGDYEGLECYYKGAYDVICTECNGANVVDVIDWDYFKDKFPKYYNDVISYENQARADRLYELAERRALGY